ncbi:acetoacetate decarboxylase [Paenibacillus sp. GCM10027626]|uniref:acetoacetate decarboxylase n=1 Tax=Paenibacillus sp. GCM10027626 TaxID=3273411 RepID=UPI0036321BE9
MNSDERFSTPLGAPLVPLFPINFRDTQILTIVYQTHQSAVEAILPRPLVPGSDTVIVHFYRMNDPDWFGPHHEFAVQVDAALPDRNVRGAYSPFIMVTTEGGLATGREIYGQPKKLGNPSIEIHGDLIVGRASRNGIDVAVGTMPYKQAKAEMSEITSYFPFTNNINYKFIPQITGEPAVRQLTSRRFEDVRVHECWKGAGTIEIRLNAQFPLYRLPVRRFLEGYYWRADLTLPFGTVIYDYLEEEGAEAK